MVKKKKNIINDTRNLSLILMLVLNKKYKKIIFMTKDSDYTDLFFKYLQSAFEEYSIRILSKTELGVKKVYIRKTNLLNEFKKIERFF